MKPLELSIEDFSFRLRLYDRRMVYRNDWCGMARHVARGRHKTRFEAFGARPFVPLERLTWSWGGDAKGP